jgi:hypothetical protein
LGFGHANNTRCSTSDPTRARIDAVPFCHGRRSDGPETLRRPGGPRANGRAVARPSGRSQAPSWVPRTPSTRRIDRSALVHAGSIGITSRSMLTRCVAHVSRRSNPRYSPPWPTGTQSSRPLGSPAAFVNEQLHTSSGFATPRTDRDSASQSAFISSRSFDLHDDFASAAPCPTVFVGSRGVFKWDDLRHLDA